MSPLIGALTLAYQGAPSKLLMCVTVDLLSGTLPVAAGWLTKLALDRLGGNEPMGTLVVLATALALVGVVQAVIPHIVGFLQAEVQRATGTLAQGRLFAAVGRFVGLAPFEDPKFLDTLRLAKQSGRSAPGMVLKGSIGAARGAVTTVGFLGSLLAVAPMMALCLLLFASPVLVAENVLSRRRAHMLWRISPGERREFFFDQLLSQVDAAKEVRLFGTAGFLLGRMQHERRSADQARRELDRNELSTQTLLALLAALVSGAGLIWAIQRASAGHLTVGDVAIFIGAMAGVHTAVAQSAAGIAQAYEAKVLFEHYLKVVRKAPDMMTVQRPTLVPPLTRGLELRDVWFRYDDDQAWVLQGVDLLIPHGRSLAVVGLNGAGKSTLVKLLCRFYDPTQGVILWDGIDIREFDPEELRQRMSAVFQDFMHYDLTARENIALGDLTSLDEPERVTEAARKSGIHKTLKRLPRGYDTLVTRMFFPEEDAVESDSGVLLSGGQLQRLALARALVRERRDFLILDEPTAGLDAEAEAELHETLRDFHDKKTSLLISHRLGSVREADLIVVLSEGRIIEKGDHNTLMNDGRAYARLFGIQSAGYTGKLSPGLGGTRTEEPAL